jgi:RNA 2',3'-cyclic 3'-phosphodiesterase
VPEGDLRLFVAVPIPPGTTRACERLIDGVRGSDVAGRLRWVRPDGLHLTLRFLGATAPTRVPDLEAALVAATEGFAAFDVALAGAGAFPSPRRPSTVWLGVAAGSAELEALARRLAPGLAGLGWPPETRPFRAHLTVARVPSPGPYAAAAVEALVDAAHDWRAPFRATSVVLYRSHLGGGPARYEAIAEAPLAR